MVNHVPGCLYLHSKKLLFLYLSNHYKRYCLSLCRMNRDVFEVIPLTFHVKAINDPEFNRFVAYHTELSKDSKGPTTAKSSSATSNIWICKPG